METLNSSSREKVKVSVIDEQAWTDHYKITYFDDTLVKDNAFIEIMSVQDLDDLIM